MKRLLSKVLFLSISATLLFTACEDDDEGVVNGDIVGSWELESLNLLYERVVSVPAGEDQNQEYKNYLDWDANGDAATAAYFQAIGDAARLGATFSTVDIKNGDNIPGFPRTTALTSPAALAGFGVSLLLQIDDAAKRGEGATYKITGTYPTIRQADCQTTITVAAITDQGLYVSDFDRAGAEKPGNFMITPDPTLGGAVLPPFYTGTYSVGEHVHDGETEKVLSIDYTDEDGHDVRYANVQDSWSEADDRVITGYNLQFNDADGNIATADPNPAVLNPAYKGGYFRSEDLLNSNYSYQMTFYFYNAGLSLNAQVADAKNPLTDLDGDGSVGVTDMVMFMHYDNLAGGGGVTPLGVPFANMVDSSDPAAPKIVDDSGTVFSGANPNAGGKMYFATREGLCVPTNEILTVESEWAAHEE
tara:strand:+ start:3328 stop:4581 length:1254 start_codon:yes stop_codon:yes gene_type:complete